MGIFTPYLFYSSIVRFFFLPFFFKFSFDSCVFLSVGKERIITMASNEDLKKAFLNFANQGKSGATVQELDNKNWTKMAKDAGLYNKTCSSTDGDITFQKYCGNKAKHINFDTFLKFIDELAPKFFKGDANAVQKYRQLIVDKGNPDNKGTKVATGNNVGKMTDTSQYTGAHKERFDEDGKGKGIEGREDVTANDGYVTSYTYGATISKAELFNRRLCSLDWVR